MTVTAAQQHVRDVVEMQLSSPAFAEFCVAHVMDPAFRFLFYADASPERQAYELLLLERRSALERARDAANGAGGAAGKAKRGANDENNRGGSDDDDDYDPSGSNAAKKPRADKAGGAERVALERFAAATHAQWQETCFRFATGGPLNVGVNAMPDRNAGGSGPRRHQAPGARGLVLVNASGGDGGDATVAGPHLPHCFASAADAAAFLALVRAARDEASIARVVAWVKQRLPMLETCMYFVFAEARRLLQASKSSSTVQQRANLFFVASTLFIEHVQSAQESGAVSYRAVYNAYLPRLVAAVMASAAAAETEEDRAATDYVREAVAAWLDSGVFTGSVAAELRAALAAKPVAATPKKK